MRRLLLLLSILGLNAQLFAQTDFCLPGATWVYYDEGNWAVNFEVENRVRYIGDTAIAPFQNAKILQTDRWYQFPPGMGTIVPLTHNEYRQYVAQSSDSIFVFEDGNWEFVFDFDVEPQDTRVIYASNDGCAPYDTMFIEVVDTIDVQGLDLRRSRFQILLDDQLQEPLLSPWGSLYGDFAERIGMMYDSPVGSRIVCSQAVTEYLPVNFVCYSDYEIVNNGGQACDLVLGTLFVDNKAQVDALLSNGQLQIQNAPNSNLSIYDILGKQLLQERVTSDSQTFDMNHLPNGILMVVVETESGRLTKKVVKASY